MTRPALACLGLLALLVGGCSSAQVARLEDGSVRISCSESMSRCGRQADLVCGDRGYTVIGGGSQGEIIGDASGHQAFVRGAELVVRCGPPPAADAASVIPEPRSVAGEPLSEASGSSGSSGSSAELAGACVPGVTQECVGPGACAGGQSCLPDGSGFGACDCGSAAQGTQPAPAPAESFHPEVDPAGNSPEIQPGWGAAPAGPAPVPPQAEPVAPAE